MFVVTGVLESLEREEASEIIKNYGGRVTGSVSGKTSHLVAGEEAGESKLAKVSQVDIGKGSLLCLILGGMVKGHVHVLFSWWVGNWVSVSCSWLVAHSH